MGCSDGLPTSLVEMDFECFFLSFRMTIGFYCLGTLDVPGFAERKITKSDREGWKAWI
ncbi:hypothetical protein BGW80DRAFT_1327147 [Lactifluus volemus]|nr:hypothetical protein BGW80DRAFT_1327147 [Lactifluus volemus]